ncbi:MAG: hypothetical protein LCH53_05845 [Bacteroidetes bacterium]|nr:hypothetical protein [Bacteroidota bacterium]
MSSEVPEAFVDTVVVLRRFPQPFSGRIEMPLRTMRWYGELDRSSQAWTYRLETAHQQTKDPAGTFDGWTLRERPRVVFADLNADGYADLWLFATDSGKAAARTSDVWLYRPSTRRYEHHKELSQVYDLGLTTTPHLLVSQPNRCGGACQVHERYWLEGERLTLLSREQYDYDSTLYVRFSRRYRGRMLPERTVHFSPEDLDAQFGYDQRAGFNRYATNALLKRRLNLRPVTVVDVEPYAR